MTTTQHNIETQLLFDLVSAKSVSGNERSAAEVFIRYANQLGFTASIDQVGNAIAHIGAPLEKSSTHIVLLGHIDTVPGDIPVRIENTSDQGLILHGRGSVDAKGPLVTMLAAASQAKLPEGVCLTVAGAVGEETDSPGARHLASQWSPDACVIGEPSSSAGITLGYKGILHATVTATKPNAHSAGKDPSANDDLITWWSAVLDMVDDFNIKPTRSFDQIQATILNMNSSSDGLTQIASLYAGFRLPTEMPPQQLQAQLDCIDSEFITIQYHGAEQAHAVTRNDPVVRAITSAIRSQGLRPIPKLKTGTADLNVVAPTWNCPIAAYGPGDSSLDHTPVEHIHLDELSQAVLILTTAISTLANELVGPNN